MFLFNQNVKYIHNDFYYFEKKSSFQCFKMYALLKLKKNDVNIWHWIFSFKRNWKWHLYLCVYSACKCAKSTFQTKPFDSFVIIISAEDCRDFWALNIVVMKFFFYPVQTLFDSVFHSFCYVLHTDTDISCVYHNINIPVLNLFSLSVLSWSLQVSAWHLILERTPLALWMMLNTRARTAAGVLLCFLCSQKSQSLPSYPWMVWWLHHRSIFGVIVVMEYTVSQTWIMKLLLFYKR